MGPDRLIVLDRSGTLSCALKRPRRSSPLTFTSQVLSPTVDSVPKRSSKPRDTNALAAAIVEQATNEAAVVLQDDSYEGKNPAAVALGRLGGRKGGKARAEKLSAAERSEIARKAARARWQSG